MKKLLIAISLLILGACAIPDQYTGTFSDNSGVTLELHPDHGILSTPGGQVKADAKQQYATELSQVDQASTSTKSAISAAKATPSVSTFGAVATAVSALGTAVKGLGNAVSNSC